MGFFWNRRKSDASADLTRALIESFSARLKSNEEMEAKREELSLRKLEIEAQYAEHLAKARIEEKNAQQDRRLKAREWGATGQQRFKAKRAAEAAKPVCPVCENSSSAHLTAADIQYHHAGHPDNFTPTFEWN